MSQGSGVKPKEPRPRISYLQPKNEVIRRRERSGQGRYAVAPVPLQIAMPTAPVFLPKLSFTPRNERITPRGAVKGSFTDVLFPKHDPMEFEQPAQLENGSMFNETDTMWQATMRPDFAPTGRSQSLMLGAWLQGQHNNMLVKVSHSDQLSTLHETIKTGMTEMVKQVASHALERGKLLGLLFSHQLTLLSHVLDLFISQTNTLLFVSTDLLGPEYVLALRKQRKKLDDFMNEFRRVLQEWAADKGTIPAAAATAKYSLQQPSVTSRSLSDILQTVTDLCRAVDEKLRKGASSLESDAMSDVPVVDPLYLRRRFHQTTQTDGVSTVSTEVQTDVYEAERQLVYVERRRSSNVALPIPERTKDPHTAKFATSEEGTQTEYLLWMKSIEEDQRLALTKQGRLFAPAGSRWDLVLRQKHLLKLMAAQDDKSPFKLGVRQREQSSTPISAEEETEVVYEADWHLFVPQEFERILLSVSRTEHFTVKSARWVVSTVRQILSAKSLADSIDIRESQRPCDMPEFLFDFFLQRCGMRVIAEVNLADVLFNVYRLRDQTALLDVFARFCGMYDPFPQEAMIFYMHVYSIIKGSKLTDDGGSQSSTLIWWVPTKRLIDVSRQLFQPMGERRLTHVLSRIDDLKDADKPERCDMDVFLRMAVEEWQEVSQQMKQRLEALFEASDTNGDNVLSFDEFQAMVHSVDATRSDRAIVRMYRTALLQSRSECIDKEIFCELMQENGMSPWTKPFLMDTMHGGSEDDPWEALESAWEDAQPIMHLQIDLIRRHAPVSEVQQVEMRQDSFTALLRERQKVDAAKFSYRMLISEVQTAIRKYCQELVTTPESRSSWSMETGARTAHRLSVFNTPTISRTASPDKDMSIHET
eukprot:TRINITY_DN15206_c0_g1_i1.p1 TRINITY_DN15206_c0_g1~~TRINITY_DN15206_c0_g1_i1.p1  ORF type:complete len:873 (-),score=166.52 TRINITY_DN15206_c0_g1_i1:36-2654(-)